jgi:hypothetical protein
MGSSDVFMMSQMHRRVLRLNRPAAVACALGVLPIALWAVPFQVPLTSRPPAVDGHIEPAEWRDAAGFDGFVSGNALQRRRVRAWVGADEQTIYVAIQSKLPDAGPLLTVVQRDSLKAVYDDAVEVFVDPNPDAPSHVDYQFLANSAGKGGYAVHKTGQVEEDESWTGGWKSAHGFHEGWWHFECAIPLSSLKTAGPGRKTTDGVWLINLCRDWKPDWTWSSLAPAGAYANTGLRFVFTKKPAPVVQYSHDGDPAFPPSTGRLLVRNPSAQPLALKAAVVLTRNNMPEVEREQTLSLRPGAESVIECRLEENDPTTVFDLALRVASTDDQAVLYERTVRWTRAREPFRWVTEPPKQTAPLDFLFAYYPSRNQMRVQADLNGLPPDARLAKVLATVREAGGGKTVQVAELPVARFKQGRQEMTLALPPLKGDYEVALAAEGQGVAPGENVKKFERHVFPWEGSTLGRSARVYPPFTAITLAGRRLSTVLRAHDLNEVGLLDQVTATSANTGIGKTILAAPMRYVVMVNGTAAPVQRKPMEVVASAGHQVVTEGGFTAGPLQATFRDTWDYDGTLKVDLTLHPTGGASLEELTLEIPFLPEAAPLLHANSDRIRAPVAQRVPPGEGVVWDGSKVACDEFLRNFCPYVYLGSAVRGLCWFAENDKGWSWNPKTSNLEVVRGGGQVLLRVHLVNAPVTLAQPRTLTFGLLAAPVKPMLNAAGQGPHWWRYRYLRDSYQLLGTDINWLALGDCGSVYPAGQDMLLWQALKKGNLGLLSEAERKQVTEHGKRYFEPYGPAAVESYVRHANHNFSSHRGANMVFYYNRASCQLFDEFETFKDEWCLDDFRSVGQGRSRGEIKVVPSDSYTDYNLFWYTKSFEIANNKGVYWDNWFIAPTFNTGMTAAYRRADGSIVPAAGFWAMRDLCRRTFVLMNELGMVPIVFPHMTSFSPLPLLAFATVQYEWEWKYSEGDVQDRYTRDYIQLVTLGEQAGVWPVPLGDQGRLGDDLWTQRTFSAVRLVHELDGQGGFGLSWMKSHQQNRRQLADPVLAILPKPGLVVFKYWEDRAQPVTATHPDVPTIVYSVPGQEAVVVAASYAREELAVTLNVDLKGLGFGQTVSVTDAETGNPLQLRNEALQFPLKKHDAKVLKFTQPKE